MANASMTRGWMVFRSVRFHWRVTVALALGVATATAVITGALLVGDSMRGSLRALTEERLGSVDFAVTPGAFFEPAGLFPDGPDSPPAVPIVLFARGVIEHRPKASDASAPESPVLRAGSVQIIGCDQDFWELDTAGVRPEVLPDEQSVVLNQASADELGVSVGDLVTVRLPREQAVPADSPLGRRESETEGLPRLKVADIIPNRGIGRFSLTPSQAEPLNLFLSRSLVTEVLDREGQANTLLIDAVQGPVAELETGYRVAKSLSERIQPSLLDYGLQLQHVRQVFPASDDADEASSEVVFDYYSLTSQRLLLPNAAVRKLTEAYPPENVQPIMTYLANVIERLDEAGNVTASVPYSTITAADPSDELPLDFTLSRDASSPRQPSDPPSIGTHGERLPLVVNSWAAEQLEARVGDTVRVAYFEPETTGGREVERTFEAVVSQIVPITEPSQPYRRRRAAVFDEPPTVFNDPDLTPTVPGITDQESISQWDTPFPLERDIDQEDDEYWNQYRLTPKAFIPLAAGRQMFGSRFGDTTGLRFDVNVADSVEDLAAEIQAKLDSQKEQLGFAVQPIRAQQLAASGGTTPFDALFLSLSMFVIFASLMLIALLFRLGLVQRCREYGTLLATGWTGRQVTQLAVREGLLAAVPGAAIGLVVGVLYAQTVLWALRTLWVGAVTVPFLEFHWTPLSLLIGFLAGLLIAWLTIRLTARRLNAVDTRMLLAGKLTDAAFAAGSKPKHRLAWIAGGLILVSLVLGGTATQMSGQAQAGLFVGAGMLLLIGILFAVYVRLATVPGSEATMRGRRSTLSLSALATGAARRNPLRSTLTIGLMASACFLIVAIGAFQLTPSDQGVGGYDLIGQTAQPLYRDLSDPQIRSDLLGPDAEKLSASEFVGLRLRPGQDASCNNLYQAMQPRVLGIPESLDQREAASEAARFAWAATSEEFAETPWKALEQPATGTESDPVPVVIDQNTAMWSLQMYDGIGEVKGFTFDDGKERYFRVVGLLSNSVLQGSLLIGQTNFKKQFPEISGDQYFLIRVGDDAPVSEVAGILENRLGDVGMDVTDSRVVLARLLAVQNTYLRTFQSLGALGLLLGTIGLAVAQLRSVLERRGELAVMRAVGFTRGRIALSVMLEHTGLLIAGIGCGAFAALLAVIPYAVLGQATLPLLEPLVWLIIILAVGLIAGIVVVVRVNRMPLLESLRGQ